MKIRERIDDKAMDKVTGGSYNSDNINLGKDAIVSVTGGRDISVRHGDPISMGADSLILVDSIRASIIAGTGIDSIILG